MLEGATRSGTDEYLIFLSGFAERPAFHENQGCTKNSGEQVLKVNVPRNDVKITIAGVVTPTSFGFGG